MDFNELVAHCDPADRARIHYITKDASGALFGHSVRPYTFEGHWRSPEGDGLYLGMTEAPAKWEECLVARPTALGALEAPVYAIAAGMAIVLLTWGYMKYIGAGQQPGQPPEQASAQEVVIDSEVKPASAEALEPAGNG